jgi:hypothetical protein
LVVSGLVLSGLTGTDGSPRAGGAPGVWAASGNTMKQAASRRRARTKEAERGSIAAP